MASDNIEGSSTKPNIIPTNFQNQNAFTIPSLPTMTTPALSGIINILSKNYTVPIKTTTIEPTQQNTTGIIYCITSSSSKPNLDCHIFLLFFIFIYMIIK
jgi:hypothetical protein